MFTVIIGSTFNWFLTNSSKSRLFVHSQNIGETVNFLYGEKALKNDVLCHLSRWWLRIPKRCAQNMLSRWLGIRHRLQKWLLELRLQLSRGNSMWMYPFAECGWRRLSGDRYLMLWMHIFHIYPFILWCNLRCDMIANQKIHRFFENKFVVLASDQNVVWEQGALTNLYFITVRDGLSESVFPRVSQ